MGGKRRLWGRRSCLGVRGRAIGQSPLRVGCGRTGGWIPACAGMTEGEAGMTEGEAGMTEGEAGMTEQGRGKG